MHTALPGSVEAYYQEIGRAGRDGEPSRAILMHSYADRHTHDFFFERDYPDVKMLDLIWDRLRAEPLAHEFVEKQSRVPRDVFEKALEKLWTHGGVIVDANEDLTRGAAEWRDSYIAQGEQKQAQIEAMIRYSQSKECRMSSLVRHFGDTADSKRACGVCDFCAPEQCVAQLFRAADEEEVALARRAVDALRGDGRALGRLHAELCATNGMNRDSFEELMGALARAGYVRLVETAFEKDGKQIPFRKAYLTREGKNWRTIRRWSCRFADRSRWWIRRGAGRRRLRRKLIRSPPRRPSRRERRRGRRIPKIRVPRYC